MTSAAAQTAQLTFGLLATDKYPKPVLIDDIEDTIKRVAERGTYASGDVKVYDTRPRTSKGITDLLLRPTSMG
jgi:hypothetical protein